jgi:hypothetical protein
MDSQDKNTVEKPGPEDHSHEWHETWNRPMHIDERGQHPFTVARMTDHNVKGRDNEEAEKTDSEKVPEGKDQLENNQDIARTKLTRQ